MTNGKTCLSCAVITAIPGKLYTPSFSLCQSVVGHPAEPVLQVTHLGRLLPFSYI